MSKSKYTNLVCVIIICLTILATILFMFGSSFGVVAVSSGSVSENTYFSEKDMDSSWSDAAATFISLGEEVEIDGAGAAYQKETVYIASAGTYVFSGNRAEIQIVVDAKDSDIQLVFDGVDVSKTDEPVIYVEDANHVYLTLEQDSENTISLTGEMSDEAIAEDLDAVIYSKCSLSMNGEGSLTVSMPGTQETEADAETETETGDGFDTEVQKVHGIKSTDDLIITGGTIYVTASGNAISGKDSVRICGGTFHLTAGNDGIKSNNDSDVDKGYILITDGDFSIISSGDGIQAETDLSVEGGNFDVTAGGGSENASAVQGNSFGMNPGMDMKNGSNMPDMEDGSTPPDMEDGNNMPDMERGNPQDIENGDNTFSDDVRGGMPGGGRGMEEMPKHGQAAGEIPEDNREEGNMPDFHGGDAAADLNDIPNDGNAGESKGMTADEISEAQGTSRNEESENDSYKGLKAGASFTISGGTFDLNCADDALHSDGILTIRGGTFLIATGDDGVHADETLLVEGGEVTVTTSFEGMEANQITIADGEIDITAGDDGINASGSNVSDTEDSSMPILRITGGTIHVNADGDGVDSNGDLIVEGGLIYIDGPTNAGNGSLDYGSESGGDCIIYGGTMIALGASGMEEVFSGNSDQTFIHYDFTSNFGEGDELTIADAQGEILFKYTVNKSGNCVIFSSLELLDGETYTVTVDGQTAEAVAGENIASNGMGMQNFRR